jgi:hypothetical protein
MFDCGECSKAIFFTASERKATICHLLAGNCKRPVIVDVSSRDRGAQRCKAALSTPQARRMVGERAPAVASRRMRTTLQA